MIPLVFPIDKIVCETNMPACTEYQGAHCLGGGGRGGHTFLNPCVKGGNRKAGNGIESQNVARNDALWREYTPFRAEIAGNKKGGNGNQSRKQAGNSRHSRPIWLGTGNYGGDGWGEEEGKGGSIGFPLY